MTLDEPILTNVRRIMAYGLNADWPIIERLGCEIPLEPGDVVFAREDVWHRTQVGRLIGLKIVSAVLVPSCLTSCLTLAQLTLRCFASPCPIWIAPGLAFPIRVQDLDQDRLALKIDVLRFPEPSDNSRPAKSGRTDFVA